MIKILVINTVRFKLNGISAVIKNYYQAMDKENINMDFLAIDNPSDEYRLFFEKNHLNCFVFHKKNIVSYFSRIIRLCRQEKYDIVHVHGNSANMAIELLAVTLGGVKNRITHSHNTSTLHPVTHKILFPLFSLLCTKRLACGVEAGKWLYKSRPFIVLKNGIILSKYEMSESVRKQYRKLLKVESNEMLIGHIGNFIEQKNHKYLIDIFKEIHQSGVKAKLLLLSDGMLMGTIKKKVKDFGLDDYVIFLGKTTEVEKYLQAMDIFLLPSLHEGLPIALIEAQAAGLPCIISEAVSQEVNLTKTCEFLPIKTESVQKWSKETIRVYMDIQSSNRFDIAKANKEKIRDCGYDIMQNADTLRQIYLETKGELPDDL